MAASKQLETASSQNNPVDLCLRPPALETEEVFTNLASIMRRNACLLSSGMFKTKSKKVWFDSNVEIRDEQTNEVIRSDELERLQREKEKAKEAAAASAGDKGDEEKGKLNDATDESTMLSEAEVALTLLEFSCGKNQNEKTEAPVPASSYNEPVLNPLEVAYLLYGIHQDYYPPIGEAELQRLQAMDASKVTPGMDLYAFLATKGGEYA